MHFFSRKKFDSQFQAIFLMNENLRWIISCWSCSIVSDMVWLFTTLATISNSIIIMETSNGSETTTSFIPDMFSKECHNPNIIEITGGNKINKVVETAWKAMRMLWRQSAWRKCSWFRARSKRWYGRYALRTQIFLANATIVATEFLEWKNSTNEHQ